MNKQAAVEHSDFVRLMLDDGPSLAPQKPNHHVGSTVVNGTYATYTISWTNVANIVGGTWTVSGIF